MQIERDVAVRAVRQAMGLCRAVRSELGAGTFEKDDHSPVTVADFGSQALVCRTLAAAFPDDPVVGEEDAGDLTGPSRAAFRGELVRQIGAALGHAVAEADALGWIDGGRGEPAGRFWTLDPIDGTKGFVRGEHYAVALALIQDGQPCVAVLGCPHLRAFPEGPLGGLFVAVAGQGTRLLRPLLDPGDDAGDRVAVSTRETSERVRWVESVESGHSDHDWSARLGAALGLQGTPSRLDSQTKYGVLARGDADLYLRRPSKPGYVEKIWDHAAGALVVTEAGGVVTDIEGRALDFSQGRTLSANFGVVASNGLIHDRVLRALADLASGPTSDQ